MLNLHTGTEPWLSECTTKWPGGLPVPDYGLPGPALAAVACYHSNEDRDSKSSLKLQVEGVRSGFSRLQLVMKRWPASNRHCC